MPDSQELPKRAACDRCRTQKLRCIRIPDHPTGSCNRCVRSHMECVSNSSKRPGRPRNSTNVSRPSNDLTPPFSISSTTENDSCIPVTDMQTLGTVDWFNLDTLNPNCNLSSDSWTTLESIFPGDSSKIVENTSLPPIVYADVSLNDFSTDTTLSERFSLQSELDSYTTNPQATRRHHSPAMDADPGVQLAVFQRELSVQMFALKSTPWDIAKALRITSKPDTASSSPDHVAEYNPLAKIAKTTEEFVNYLHSLQHSSGRGKEGESSPGSSPESLLPSSLSVTHLLTVLSCHMLTLSICELIFSHLDNALQNSSVVSELLSSTPQLFLGGVEVPSRLDMLGHLLNCLARSLLRPAEILLGLPDDFCITPHKDQRVEEKELGLFSGQSGTILFSTLLKMEEERTKEGGGGLGVIVSLKDKIRKVQGLA